MVGISDGNNDGKFKIQRGQGISQAIATELGLNAQQCRKLGSVWTEIFKEVDKQNEQTKFYSGGNDLHGPIRENYIVHPNQEVTFSTEIWNKIVQLVNAKLGTNIQTTEGGAPPAANEAPPANNEPPASQPPAAQPPAPADGGEDTPPPAQHKISMAGTDPKIKVKTFCKEPPNVTNAVNKLKGETQSNWAVSSNMKEALGTVTEQNVAYFVQKYNYDGSDIVKDIDGCTGWNKKDVYENLTQKLAARAKAQGIDISKYKEIANLSSVPNNINLAHSVIPSLDAQKKFLTEVSSLIVENEFAARYKAQITKVNATIKQYADAPVDNIQMTKPDDAKNGLYGLTLCDGSIIFVSVAGGKISNLSIRNQTSPDTHTDLSYNFNPRGVGLDPDEKDDGSGHYKKGQAFSNNNTIPFDKLKEVATEMLKKMGVKFAKQ